MATNLLRRLDFVTFTPVTPHFLTDMVIEWLIGHQTVLKEFYIYEVIPGNLMTCWLMLRDLAVSDHL